MLLQQLTRAGHTHAVLAVFEAKPAAAAGKLCAYTAPHCCTAPGMGALQQHALLRTNDVDGVGMLVLCKDICCCWRLQLAGDVSGHKRPAFL